VRFVTGALVDPKTENLPVALGERGTGVGRRHDLVVLLAVDALPGDRLLALAGNEGVAIEGVVFTKGVVGKLGGVEAQPGLVVVLVATVAAEALLREERPDLEIVADRPGRRRGRSDRGER
jgi:hypothetical protein